MACRRDVGVLRPRLTAGSARKQGLLKEAWVSTQAAQRLSGRRSRDTEPELMLRRALHAAGLRFRLQRLIARGHTADLVLPGRRIAVFVDGDFWHSCPVHGRKTFAGPNAALWTEKLERNRRRDAEAVRLGSEQGWTVVRVWECSIRADPAVAASYVARGEAPPPSA
jgi:DNA mismatch endonuclease (patch repair protein)